MKSLAAKTAFLLCPLAVLAFPQQNHLHARHGAAGMPNKTRANAVKEAFEFAWHGYYTYAFPNDELHPVSNSYGNSRNGWGASAVDALSTALVMDEKVIVKQILDYIPTIDYTHTTTEVSLFETTIRYVAGMLSGYDLLKGPLAHLADNSSNVDALLSQAKVLADSLKFAFNTSTGIPNNNLYFTNESTDGSTTNALATVGSLVLEWTRLSDLLGDDQYAEVTQKAESYLLNPQPAYNEPWPGLLGTNIDIDTAMFLDATGGWIANCDSFYEYLIKMFVYDQDRFGKYKDRWILAADSTIAHLASNPSSRPDLTYLDYYNNQSLVNVSEHLACFDGGNFILGGDVLGRQDYIDFGLALVDGCRNTYISTVTGIGPEIFAWNTSEADLPLNDTVDRAFYSAHGFYITDGVYDLRPEMLESMYHAYRYTKNKKYQEWSWEAFVAINASARRGSGFSEISDVNIPGGGVAGDNQESFFFAEVMKYAYLIHAEEAEYQLNSNGTNKWVLNTEAHPLKVYGTPV